MKKETKNLVIYKLGLLKELSMKNPYKEVRCTIKAIVNDILTDIKKGENN